MLVFEDLHWADDALLDFVDYLVDWASGVPLLVLCTARPELLTRRPDWGGGKVNSATILVSPLSDDETATLVHALLGRSAIDADLQARLLEHAGGNPLYAEEFTRMLLERPTETSVPENVHGMIAARLDTLSAEEKALAAGRRRWSGGSSGSVLSAASAGVLEERLHSLGAQGVRRLGTASSSVAGEDEYTFRHALVRDVAYEQIPRSERAARHQGAAEWIESLGRPEDHAEMLAHHYTAALDATRELGAGRRAARRAEPRLRFARPETARSRSTPSRQPRVTTSSPSSSGRHDDPKRARSSCSSSRARTTSAGTSGAINDRSRQRAKRCSGQRRGDLAAEADALLAEARWNRRDREQCDRYARPRGIGLVVDLPDSAGENARR